MCIYRENNVKLLPLFSKKPEAFSFSEEAPYHFCMWRTTVLWLEPLWNKICNSHHDLQAGICLTFLIALLLAHAAPAMLVFYHSNSQIIVPMPLHLMYPLPLPQIFQTITLLCKLGISLNNIPQRGLSWLGNLKWTVPIISLFSLLQSTM